MRSLLRMMSAVEYSHQGFKERLAGWWKNGICGVALRPASLKRMSLYASLRVHRRLGIWQFLTSL